jgi:hypothetical protein
MEIKEKYTMPDRFRGSDAGTSHLATELNHKVSTSFDVTRFSSESRLKLEETPAATSADADSKKEISKKSGLEGSGEQRTDSKETNLTENEPIDPGHQSHSDHYGLELLRKALAIGIEARIVPFLQGRGEYSKGVFDFFQRPELSPSQTSHDTLVSEGSDRGEGIKTGDSCDNTIVRGEKTLREYDKV